MPSVRGTPKCNFSMHPTLLLFRAARMKKNKKPSNLEFLLGATLPGDPPKANLKTAKQGYRTAVL